MLTALYHAEIVALARQSRERKRLEAPDASARVDNPLCGDRVTIDLALTDGRITAVGHRIRGCALCEAAAEIIAESAVGMSVADVLVVEDETRVYLESDGGALQIWPQLFLFAPVREVPVRHQCVLLPFTAVRTAIGTVDVDAH